MPSAYKLDTCKTYNNAIKIQSSVVKQLMKLPNILDQTPK